MPEPLAFLSVTAALWNVVPPLQKVIYMHFDRRSKTKRELADELAAHLRALARLFKKAAKLIREGDKKGQIGDVCAQLHTEMDLLGRRVISKVLGKAPADRFLAAGHRAADAEGVAAELLGKNRRDLEPYVKTLEEAAGTFRGLGAAAARKGTTA